MSHSGLLDGDSAPHTLGWHILTDMQNWLPLHSRSVIKHDGRAIQLYHGKGYNMARPKKEKELKRNHPVMLRFNDTEYEIITENANGAGLPLAEFLRRQIMDKRVTVKYEIVADVPELKKLIAEFGKIGSNLNQIARHFNQGGIHSQEMRQAINKCIAEIYEMKYEVIKMAGDFHGDTETHSK